MNTAPEQSRSSPQISTSHRVKVPSMLQQAAVECGAASLGMILAHLGRWETLDHLRTACGVSRDGSTAINIVQAAESYGLEGEGHRGEVADLAGLTMPAIIWWRRCHFMVLEGATKGTFYVNDPARGGYALSTEDFAEGYSGAAITFTQSSKFTPAGHKYRTSSALWSRLKHSRAGVNFMILAGVLAMLLGLVTAPLSQIFINDVLSLERNDIIPGLVTVLIIVGLFRSGLTLLEYGVIARLQMKVTVVGSSDFLTRLIRLPLMFYLERSAGDLSQRVGYNGQVAQLLGNQMASAGIAVLAALGYALLLLYYNVTIGLVVLALSLINVIVLKLVMAKRTMAQSRLIRKQNQLRGTTTSSIQGIETIKSTGMEDDVFTTLAGQQSDYISTQATLAPTTALLSATPVLLFALTSASILVLGGYFTITGSFTVGGLLAMQVLSANLNSPVQTLMSTGSQLQVITSSLEALDDVTANEPDIRFARPSITAPSDIPDLAGRVTFDNVTFGYSRLAEPLIENFELDINPGRRVALVGGSGSGKTTIANLAAGLFTPWSGQVLHDGKPLSEYPSGVIENHLTKVDQSIVLFEGTVRDNVTLWNPMIPDNEVQLALADAQILKDVLAREGGLDAVVEENGRNFSGGQCQRLEIARALATTPQVIVLDEATSALDDITEQLVDQALRRRGLTCLIVAHRLSTIRDADEIIVLGRGGVVLERGSHNQLMSSGGHYARMVSDAGEGGSVGS